MGENFPKKIMLIAMGTRGDVQPLVALGCALRSQGFGIKLIVEETYAFLPKACRLSYQSIKGVFTMFEDRTVPDKMNEIWHGCQDVDALVFSPHPFSLVGYHIAEKLDIPCFWAASFPMHQVPGFPEKLLPGPNIYRFYNRLFHEILCYWRENTLRLPVLPKWPPFPPWKRIHDQKLPFLYFFDQTLLPRPLSWPEWIHVTGFWFLDSPDDWELPGKLEEYFSRDDPLIYIGFGSVFDDLPEEWIKLTQKALNATETLGVMCVDLEEPSRVLERERLLLINSCPHSRLFPEMSAVVHHGGLNTTAETLRAGVPSITVPFMTDGPLWSHCLHRLGLSPLPLNHDGLSCEDLAQAIHTLSTNHKFNEKANLIKQKLCGQKGAEKASSIISDYLA